MKKENAHDRELEQQIKQLEFETQKIKHELQPEARDRSKTEFDVSISTPIVPKFQKKYIHKYFIHFEKIAENSKWA